MTLIRVCDICKSLNNVRTHRFTVGSQSDLSGNGHDNIVAVFDLCGQCTVSILSYGIKQIHKNNFDKRVEIGKESRKSVKKYDGKNVISKWLKILEKK